MVDISNVAPEKVAKKPVAEKSYVDAAGIEVGIEAATGLKYVSLVEGKPSKTTILQVAAMGATVLLPGDSVLMQALFGASQLATNTASFNRNSAKAEDAFPDDVDAVNDRFGRIAHGDWGTKGGGGFAIDLDVLAQAAEKFAGRPIPDLAAWKATMEAQPVTRKTLRGHKNIAPIYDEIMRERRLAGKPEVDVNTVLGF